MSLPENEAGDLLENLPKAMGLEGFGLVKYRSSYSWESQYILQLPLNSRDLLGGENPGDLSRALFEIIENTTYVKNIRKGNESRIQELEAQIKDLERYKTHFEMEKEKLKDSVSTSPGLSK